MAVISRKPRLRTRWLNSLLIKSQTVLKRSACRFFVAHSRDEDLLERGPLEREELDLLALHQRGQHGLRVDARSRAKRR